MNTQNHHEEHKSIEPESFSQAASSQQYACSNPKGLDKAFKSQGYAQCINPEGGPLSNEEEQIPTSKGSKFEYDKAELPTELAKKLAFNIQKNSYHKKHGGYVAKNGREYDANGQFQYNELYDLESEENKVGQQSYPFPKEQPFYYGQQQQFYHQPKPSYQNSYASPYQSESDTEYLAHMQAGYLDKQKGYVQYPNNTQHGQQQRAQRRFTEKHLIESLQVNAAITQKPVMFYNMLNQGNKRGKETQVLALDCERVLTDKGERLARVSIVNFYGNIVFDTLVKPCDTYYEEHQVLDYREWITGIKPIDLDHAPTFGNIEPIIKKIVKDKTIVGHSLQDDFKILKLDPIEANCVIRDISAIKIFMRKVDKDSLSPIREKEDDEDSLVRHSISGSKHSSQDGSNSTPVKSKKKVIANFIVIKRKLKELSEEFLNAQIQEGHHSSVIDARAALALYRMHYEEIETEFRLGQALKELELRRAEKETCQPKKLIQDFRAVMPEQKQAKSQKSDTDDKSFKSFGSDKENEANSMNVKSNPSSHEPKKSDSSSPASEDTRNILQMMKTSENSMKAQEMKDLEYLFKHKTEIFNITPPNAKDEDKIKKAGQKYQLIQKDQNPEWRGFKSSHILHDKTKKYQPSYAKQSNHRPYGRYHAGGYNNQNRKIDPFSQNWTYSQNEAQGQQSERSFQHRDNWKKMRYQDDDEEAEGQRRYRMSQADSMQYSQDQSKSATNPEI